MVINTKQLKIETSSEPVLETNGKIITIYNTYHLRLKRYIATRLKSQEDVDDIAQEVYLRLIRNYNVTDLQPSLALLCKIASNIIIDRFRRDITRASAAHVDLEAVELESFNASPEKTLQAKEELDQFAAEFKKLNKVSQKVFVLHRFRGLTYDEIAQQMGISKSMVYKHLSAVMLHMAKVFGKNK